MMDVICVCVCDNRVCAHGKAGCVLGLGGAGEVDGVLDHAQELAVGQPRHCRRTLGRVHAAGCKKRARLAPSEKEGRRVAPQREKRREEKRRDGRCATRMLHGVPTQCTRAHGEERERRGREERERQRRREETVDRQNAGNADHESLCNNVCVRMYVLVCVIVCMKIKGLRRAREREEKGEKSKGEELLR